MINVTVNLNDCLIYAGSKNAQGYGVNSHGGVHRQMYEHFVGIIPDNLEIDHLCRVPSCINPDHLEAVTHRLNMQRAYDYSEYCKKGLHLMQGENLYFSTHPKFGTFMRQCRPCLKEYVNKNRYKQKAFLMTKEGKIAKKIANDKYRAKFLKEHGMTYRQYRKQQLTKNGDKKHE